MEVQCRRAGLDVEFIEAVYGRDVANVKDLIRKSKATTVERLGREMTPGEIGCSMSHQAIYKRMMDAELEYALILEDDIEFDEDIKTVIASVLESGVEWDIVLLGYSEGANRYHWDLKRTDEITITEKLKLGLLNQKAYGTYAYLVNGRTAEKLYDASISYHFPIDHYTGDFQTHRIWIALPPVVRIHDPLSDQGCLIEERLNVELTYMEQKFGKYKPWIDAQMQITGKVILYGYNDFAKWIYHTYPDKIHAVVDTYKKGCRISGIDIVGIDDIRDGDSPFLISAIEHSKILQIRKTIETVYPKSPIIALDGLGGVV